MFWNKKKKLPITEEDKIWVDEDLNWLKIEFGYDHFTEIRTVTPTKDFYERTFDGTEKDAEFILERTMELMKIEDVNINLDENKGYFRKKNLKKEEVEYLLSKKYKIIKMKFFL